MERRLRDVAVVIHVRVVPGEHRVRLVHVLFSSHRRGVMARVLRAIEACDLVLGSADAT